MVRSYRRKKEAAEKGGLLTYFASAEKM